MSKASRARKQKAKLKEVLREEYPVRTFMCLKCGKPAPLSWKVYATGKVIECWECGGVMKTITGK